MERLSVFFLTENRVQTLNAGSSFNDIRSVIFSWCRRKSQVEPQLKIIYHRVYVLKLSISAGITLCGQRRFQTASRTAPKFSDLFAVDRKKHQPYIQTKGRLADYGGIFRPYKLVYGISLSTAGNKSLNPIRKPPILKPWFIARPRFYVFADLFTGLIFQFFPLITRQERP
jgi:hypothetical protein